MNLKELATGAVVVVIGATAFTVSEEDIAKNFAEDMGLTQEQAEQYINDIPEDELLSSFTEVGESYIELGEYMMTYVDEVDCDQYSYEWESETLTCSDGKDQLLKYSNSNIQVGENYKKLDLESAGKLEVETAITGFDNLIKTYDFEVLNTMYGEEVINEDRSTDVYNRSILKASLESM